MSRDSFLAMGISARDDKYDDEVDVRLMLQDGDDGCPNEPTIREKEESDSLVSLAEFFRLRGIKV